jgi:hypothetical protein
MPGNKSAILVLISLLVVALIFSSTSRFYVFGKSVVVNSQCHSSSDLKSKTCCYTNYNAQNGAYFTTCIDCEISKVSGNWECGKEYYVATPPSALSPPDNNTSPPLSHPIPPPSAGAAQPPSSPPATPPSNALLPPSTSQQTTCPDGSAPDANGNCPSTSTTNQQIAPNQNLASNNLQPEQHHHKGSNLPAKESTSKKDNVGGSDQGTQPPP